MDPEGTIREEVVDQGWAPKTSRRQMGRQGRGNAAEEEPKRATGVHQGDSSRRRLALADVVSGSWKSLASVVEIIFQDESEGVEKGMVIGTYSVLAHRPREFTGIRFCRRVIVQRVVAELVSLSMVEMSDHNEQEWA